MRSPPRIHAAARRLRREMTPPEVRLWLRLKANADGPRIRRQHPLENFVLDFYCPAARLAIEVDGWGHNMGDQPARDERRDARLAELGIEVLRIPAGEVMTDADAAAAMVFDTCVARIAELHAPPQSAVPPPPLRRGAG